MISIRPASAAAVLAARRANSFTAGGLSCGVALALACGVNPVHAQEAAGATSAGAAPAATLEEVTVTGSRIKRTTDFNTPTPTTVIDADLMTNMGVVNVGEALTMTPANVSTFTPANTGNSNFFSGAYIADLRGLNPFFGSRTLVLVNTRRVVQTNQGDSVDLNFIPQILVDRVDTVTGGASAAYGSGAIAGVVNVILDNKLEGGKINGDFYQTSHSDARDRHFGAAYGHGLFDERVHFVVGGEYEKQDALGCETVRTWCAQNAGLYSLNPTTAGVGPGVTVYGQANDLRFNQITSPGVFQQAQPGPFPPNPYANYTSVLQASPDGTGATAYQLGAQPYSTAFLSTTLPTLTPGGQGIPRAQYDNLMAPVSRGVITGSLTAKLTDAINFSADVNWGKVQTTNFAGVQSTGIFMPTGAVAAVVNPATGAVIAPAGVAPGGYNPYIVNSPALVSALQSQFCTGPAAATCGPGPGGTLLPPTLSIGKDWTGQTPTFTDVTTTVRRFTFGFDGKIGQSSWSWDSYFEYGRTQREQFLQNNIRAYSLDAALDAVQGPNGAECRTAYEAANGLPLTTYGGGTLPATNPGYVSALLQGCTPIDPLGTQAIPQNAINYSFGPLDERLRYTQTVGAINASGNIFPGIGAGAFSLAAGFEWRQEVGHNDEVSCPYSDIHCQAAITDFNIQYGQPFGGIVTVEEGYLEANLPLAKNLPFANLLELDVAGRESHYDNKALYGIDVVNGQQPEFTHNLTTWKASLIWEPIPGVRFRGSQSRDARAANFRELYYGQIITAGSAFGSCAPPGSGINDPCTWNLEGNVKLRPETSDTTTLGIVLTPSDWVSGLQFSADWFHIRINDAIEQANPTLTQAQCRAGETAVCDLMTFNPFAYNGLGEQCGTLAGFPVPAPVDCTGPTYTGAAAWQHGAYNATSFVSTSFNGAFYEIRGIDFSLNYAAGIGQYGRITTRLLTTWMDEQKFRNCTETFPGAPCYTYNILGQTGSGNNFLADYTPAAKWRGSLLVTWSNGPLSITPSMSFVSRGIRDYLGVTPGQPQYAAAVANPNLLATGIDLHPMQDNHMPSYFLFNLNGTYSFQTTSLKGLEVFLQVNNVFNKKPPFAVGGGIFGASNGYGGTNPIFFDALGLAWRAGFRMSF
jgi:iron complex outermembrane recepter protein